jgi:trehalose-6-phosphate synthase
MWPRDFYEGIANQTLWPVFHYFPSQLRFDAKEWAAYVAANRIFCRAVVDWYQPGDLIWVHDYHLLLLPRMLREAVPGAAIGFFLHIPFPSSEVFPVLPGAKISSTGSWELTCWHFKPTATCNSFALRCVGCWVSKAESPRSDSGAGQFALRRSR